MVATISAGTTATYYTQAAANYYAGASVEAPGYWATVGAALGIEVGTAVDSATFERLHAAVDADGRSLVEFRHGHGEGRVGGYDLTFSAPKSCSIVWALADDGLRREIEIAQAGAVDAALSVLTSHATWCRSGKGGIRLEPARPTTAVFLHGEARPEVHDDGRVFADPQLHSHAVVVNLGQKPDGRFGALDGRPLFQWKMALGATYHAELAKRLGDLGFSITDVGRNGTFEVAGIDEKLLRYFSARRTAVEEGLAEAGVDDSADAPALAAAVTRNTRRQKQESKESDRFALWRDRALDQGVATDLVMDSRAATGSLAERVDRDTERAVAERVALVPNALTEHESIFERRELHAAVATALVGTGAGAARIEAEIEKLEQRQNIVVLDRDVHGQPIYSTPEILTIEREIGEIAARLSQGAVTGLDHATTITAIDRAKLNSQQVAAAHAATSGAAITIVEGAPGTGKTTTLRPVVEAWQAAGYRVIGTATAWRIANGLHRDLGIEARATDSWLATEVAGGHFLDDRTVLIVDEAGLLSSRQMHAVLAAADRAAGFGRLPPRIVLVGDRGQLQSVGAGSGLRLIANVLPVQRVETIVRQHEEWARDAVSDFGAGRASEALAAFETRGLYREAANAKACVTGLVDAWQKSRPDHPDHSRLLIARTNAQVRAVSEEIRRRLRASGEITGDDATIDAATRSGQRVTLPLAKGDRVRFLVRAHLADAEVVNGTEGRIAAVNRIDDRRADLSVDIGGRHIRFSSDQISDETGRALLTHAYASTVHGAQGLTVDEAFVWVSPEMDRHDIYVAASRARFKTHLFADRQTIDARLTPEAPLDRRSAADEVAPTARRELLVEQLARPGLKRTTLDVLLAARARAERIELEPEISSKLPGIERTSAQPHRQTRENTLA